MIDLPKANAPRILEEKPLDPFRFRAAHERKLNSMRKVIKETIDDQVQRSSKDLTSSLLRPAERVVSPDLPSEAFSLAPSTASSVIQRPLPEQHPNLLMAAQTLDMRMDLELNRLEVIDSSIHQVAGFKNLHDYLHVKQSEWTSQVARQQAESSLDKEQTLGTYLRQAELRHATQVDRFTGVAERFENLNENLVKLFNEQKAEEKREPIKAREKAMARPAPEMKQSIQMRELSSQSDLIESSVLPVASELEQELNLMSQKVDQLIKGIQNDQKLPELSKFSQHNSVALEMGDSTDDDLSSVLTEVDVASDGSFLAQSRSNKPENRVEKEIEQKTKPKALIQSAELDAVMKIRSEELASRREAALRLLAMSQKFQQEEQDVLKLEQQALENLNRAKSQSTVSLIDQINEISKKKEPFELVPKLNLDQLDSVKTLDQAKSVSEVPRRTSGQEEEPETQMTNQDYDYSSFEDGTMTQEPATISAASRSKEIEPVLAPLDLTAKPGEIEAGDDVATSTAATSSTLEVQTAQRTPRQMGDVPEDSKIEDLDSPFSWQQQLEMKMRNLTQEIQETEAMLQKLRRIDMKVASGTVKPLITEKENVQRHRRTVYQQIKLCETILKRNRKQLEEVQHSLMLSSHSMEADSIPRTPLALKAPEDAISESSTLADEDDLPLDLAEPCPLSPIRSSPTPLSNSTPKRASPAADISKATPRISPLLVEEAFNFSDGLFSVLVQNVVEEVIEEYKSRQPVEPDFEEDHSMTETRDLCSEVAESELDKVESDSSIEEEIPLHKPFSIPQDTSLANTRVNIQGLIGDVPERMNDFVLEACAFLLTAMQSAPIGKREWALQDAARLENRDPKFGLTFVDEIENQSICGPSSLLPLNQLPKVGDILRCLKFITSGEQRFTSIQDSIEKVLLAIIFFSFEV
ncbi:Golgin A4 [Cichlidogyrus casuarinus]|uniref:Golgin A4 n=1 Tax=Cichlidogyrus casuarinus TaxID=1844966 RepID=A0ABD2QQJ0_9PLAT